MHEVTDVLQRKEEKHRGGDGAVHWANIGYRGSGWLKGFGLQKEKRLDGCDAHLLFSSSLNLCFSSTFFSFVLLKTFGYKRGRFYKHFRKLDFYSNNCSNYWK
jgi:hypothetical protein